MSDLRTRLERIGDRARPAPDAFARFEGTRRRRERNRRISAGVVAFVVAAAGSIGIFSLVGDDGENVLGGGEGEFLALWPETTLEAAEAFQQRVDEAITEPGPTPDELAWRLDPDATALRFVNEALGWPETEDELAHSSTTSPDGTVTVDIVTGIGPGPCQRPECAGRDVILTLRQLLPGGQIWSVVAAQSSVFNIALHVNEEVEIGTDIVVHAGFELGTEVAVGFAGTGPCDAFHEETVPVTDLAVSAAVPEVLAGCTGYVYALTPSTAEGQVELGRIMFPCCGMNDKPALGYTIQAISAVPVRFVDAAVATSEPAQIGRISCDGADPVVQTPVVATQPDGVHIRVTNPTDQTISFSIGPDIGSPDAAVSSLVPGTVELVLTGAPGTMSFSCSPPPEEGQAAASGLGRFEIVDPAGNYVPADLECDAGSAYGSGAAQPAGGGGGGSGFTGDPVQVVRDHVSGLEFDDLVERAGYLGTEAPVIRIVRDGAVVGKVTLSGDGSGGWLLNAIEGCGGTRFGWSEEPTGVSGPMGGTGSGSFEGCPPANDQLHLVGRDIDFDLDCLSAPAGVELQVLFTNLDEGIPRNVAIYPCTSVNEPASVPGCVEPKLDKPAFVGEAIDGTQGQIEIVYLVPALEPGVYQFQDDIHPTIGIGVLVVG